MMNLNWCLVKIMWLHVCRWDVQAKGVERPGDFWTSAAAMNSVCENERLKIWWPTSWRACEKENWTRQRHGQQADHEDNRGSKCVGQPAGHASLGCTRCLAGCRTLAGKHAGRDEGLNSLFSMLVQARWLSPIVRCKINIFPMHLLRFGKVTSGLESHICKIPMAQGVSTTIPCQSQSAETPQTHTDDSSTWLSGVVRKRAL